MEHATDRATPPLTRARGTYFNPTSQLGLDMPAAGYLDLADYQSRVPSRVGAIRVCNAGPQAAWERHDLGDELLVLLSGSFTMTLRDAEGRTIERPMSRGDVLVIPTGVAHHATLHTDEVQLLFITPRAGTKEWSESGPALEDQP
jgi:oxalate decarboxylase/phosphoglucose isomerase-like protein (cupin superfamily)